MAIRYNSGAAREATGLKQMPIRARTHKTGAGGMSASLIGHSGSSAFRLSTTTVLMSLTGSCFSSESAPGALASWDSRTRWNNLWGGLAVRRTVGPSGHANSPHPSSREGHHSTARWSSSVLLLDWMLHGFHAAAAAVACSRVQRNSVPSTHMRCMITANRRARATIAFFIPRRLAICIAQALSRDHAPVGAARARMLELVCYMHIAQACPRALGHRLAHPCPYG